MMRVKICGITNSEDAKIAEDNGADILGFVFAESPRRIEPKKACEIIKKLSSKIKVAALFVNEKKDIVDSVIKELGRIDFIQFHGDETADYCKQFKDKKIIKAFRIKDESSLEKIADFNGVDFILLDAFSDAKYGGTGKTFSWGLARKAKDYGIPIILSGGLNPDNVKDAILKVKPYGVDVSSGVENSPGKKDPELVKNFIAQAKSI